MLDAFDQQITAYDDKVYKTNRVLAYAFCPSLLHPPSLDRLNTLQIRFTSVGIEHVVVHGRSLFSHLPGF